MHRSTTLRRALLFALLALFTVEAQAQRGRGSSSSGYRSSGSGSVSSRPSVSVSRPSSPSVSRPSYSPPSRPSYTPSSRPSYTPTTSGSSGSSWRSTGSSTSYGSRGSYVRPSLSRGTTRYVPSGTTDYGRSSSPSTRYTPSSTPGSTYDSPSSSRDSLGSDWYGSRGDASSDRGLGAPDAGGGSERSVGTAETGDWDVGVYEGRSRTPTFPRAYRPTTYSPRTYAPRTYGDDARAGDPGTSGSAGGPATPRSTAPRDVSDIIERYRGTSGRGERGGHSDDVLTDIARRNGGGSLRPPGRVSEDDSPYGRGPLRRLSPGRGSRGDAEAPGDAADPGGVLAPGDRLAPRGTGGSDRRTRGELADGVTTIGSPRVARGVVTPGAGGSGGYVTPGGGGVTTAPTITTLQTKTHHHFHHFHHAFSFCYSPYFYWGWYSWCAPYFVYHWYWGWYYPYYYGPTYVAYDSPAVVVVDRAEVVGEGAVDYGAAAMREGPSSPDERSSLTTAAERYLNLGDRAFREGRYGDAVHFYAKAVEFSPDEGVLYLVLADALFATGDYHYAAFAIRKALALDPNLVDAVVDKHGFYGDPSEFERQLVVLEAYVRDHPTDTDSRLVLALNYLFGSRSADAVDVLDSPYSERLRTDDAAALILDRARRSH